MRDMWVLASTMELHLQAPVARCVETNPSESPTFAPSFIPEARKPTIGARIRIGKRVSGNAAGAVIGHCVCTVDSGLRRIRIVDAGHAGKRKRGNVEYGAGWRADQERQTVRVPNVHPTLSC